MNEELRLMKEMAQQNTQQLAAAAPKVPESPLEAARKQREAFDAKPAAPEVASAVPVQPTAVANIVYRDPDSGLAQHAAVTLRVLLKTDERMLVWQVAYNILRMPWAAAPADARDEAYAQAVCRIQWEEDTTVPAWFKRAYETDIAFSISLANEVDALTDAYFRGGNGAGGVATTQRFVVKREGNAPAAATAVAT